MSQTDDRRPTTDTSVAKGRPKNTVVNVFLGVEDHRANFFVSLSLALKVQALALALSVQALALALSVQTLTWPWPRMLLQVTI